MEAVERFGEEQGLHLDLDLFRKSCINPTQDKVNIHIMQISIMTLDSLSKFNFLEGLGTKTACHESMPETKRVAQTT